jgi:hypothetical protein
MAQFVLQVLLSSQKPMDAAMTLYSDCTADKQTSADAAVARKTFNRGQKRKGGYDGKYALIMPHSSSHGVDSVGNDVSAARS